MTMEIFITRLKSFAWRFGCVALIAGLNWAANNLTGLELPAWAVTIIGLGIGEVTKWLNNHTNMFGAALKQ
jgi:hypothetical protein